MEKIPILKKVRNRDFSGGPKSFGPETHYRKPEPPNFTANKLAEQYAPKFCSIQQIKRYVRVPHEQQRAQKSQKISKRS